MKTSKNFITFKAWYQDDKGIPQCITYSTGCNLNYSDYCKYPYFGVESYVTDGDTPPLWKYQSYPIDYKTAEEHGGRSFRTILFSDSSGLRPVDIRSPTKKISIDLENLRKTCFLIMYLDGLTKWVICFISLSHIHLALNGQIYFIQSALALSKYLGQYLSIKEVIQMVTVGADHF